MLAVQDFLPCLYCEGVTSHLRIEEGKVLVYTCFACGNEVEIVCDEGLLQGARCS